VSPPWQQRGLSVSKKTNRQTNQKADSENVKKTNFRRRQVFELLIKDILYALAHSGYNMIRTVKCGGVLEYQTNVCNEFIGVVIARSVFIAIGFDRMGRNELAIDC
jgi:hypothetical protein